MLRGFATINYWADDMEAAKRWYADLLGVEPYFERPGPHGKVAYAEFRIGDYQHEPGILDRKFSTAEPADRPRPIRPAAWCTGTSTTRRPPSTAWYRSAPRCWRRPGISARGSSGPR